MEKEFNEALEDLIDEYVENDTDRSDIKGALELKLMAYREEDDDKL